MGKKASAKRTVVKLGTAKMTVAERVKFARDTANVAKNCAAYQGSAQAQASMAAWLKSNDALDQNQQQIGNAEKLLVTLRGQQVQLVLDYDVDARDYAGIVQTLAKDDPTIVSAMGLVLRANAEHYAQLASPIGLTIATSRAGVESLVWDKVPGALLYVAQVSVDPATDATWTTLAGHGRRRSLSGLAHGQKYLLRVKAMGANGDGLWSAILGITAK